MRLLLDTHVFLWLVEGSSQLSARAGAALSDPLNELFLSVASIWELAIKTSNGKLVLREPLDAFVVTWTATYRLKQVAVETPHALRVATLPPHHRDPFDRLLIGQAHCEGMTLVSADPQLASYGVPLLW